MARKQGGHGTRTPDKVTLSFYVPDKLHEMVKNFAKSSGSEVEDAYHNLLTKGLVAESSRDYFDLLLRRNSLSRNKRDLEYSRDNSILTHFLDQVRTENAEMKELLLKRGLLRHIPERPRS